MAASIMNVGSVFLFAGKQAPLYHLPCDGRKLYRSDYTILCSMRGIYSSGDDLWLPKLEPISGISYIIRVEGSFDQFQLNYEVDFEETDRMIGVIAPLKGDTIPEGWLLCDGRKLAQDEATRLQVVIGEKYIPKNANFNTYHTAGCYLPKFDTPHVICAEGTFPDYY